MDGMAGTLSATVVSAIVPVARNGDFTAAGALAADSISPIVAGSVVFSGAGGLSAAAYALFTRSAALAGVGTLAATGTAKFAMTPAFNSAGALAATGLAKYARSAGFTSTGQLQATAEIVPQAVVRLGKGAGGRATNAAGVSWTSYNITASGPDTLVLVAASLSEGTSQLYINGVTYGGVAMTAVQRQKETDAPYRQGLPQGNTAAGSAILGAVQFWYLFNPPTGAQTVAIACDAGMDAVAGIDLAFAGVGAVGSSQKAVATSHTLRTDVDGYAVRALMNGAALSAPNQTSEYLAGSSVGGSGDYLAVQSAATTGDTTAFTCSGTASSPGSYGLFLYPDPGVVRRDSTAEPATMVSTAVANATRTWTHTVAAGAKCAVVVLYAEDSSDTIVGSTTRTVTFGGVAMTSQGVKTPNNSTSYGMVEVFTLVNPPTGAQSVTFTVSSGARTFFAAAQSFTYFNVSAVASPQSSAGTRTGAGSVSYNYTNASATPKDLLFYAWNCFSSQTPSISFGQPLFFNDEVQGQLFAGNGDTFPVWAQPMSASAMTLEGRTQNSLPWALVAVTLVGT